MQRPLRLVALLVTASVAAAGCLAPETVETASLPDAAAATGGLADVVAATASGLAPLPPGFQDLEVRLVHAGFDSAEPTIGVTSDGSIFVPGGGASVMRSTDGGESWEDVGAKDPIGPKANLDPYIYVDPWTDRVFNLPLYVACSHMQWSDDGGETWQDNPVAGCGVPAHDHQKLAAGPPRGSATTQGYPNVLYYAYNGAFRGLVGVGMGASHPLTGTWVARSLDGGRTFDVGQKVIASECHSGINAPPKADAEGIVYVASAGCDAIRIAVSEDSGATWDVAEAGADVGVQERLAVNPNVATDSEGNAYVVWPAKDGTMRMSVSRDHGKTWGPSIRVSSPAVTSTVFSVVAAGAPGRVTVAYLATDADTSKWETKSAQDAPDDTVWHLVTSTSLDALSADPTFVSTRVTPQDDPIQVGCVWLSGGSNSCRNLLDFIGIAEQGGRVYVVAADGCPRGCKDGPDVEEGPLGPARSSEAVIAIVERGPSLVDPLTPLVPLG